MTDRLPVEISRLAGSKFVNWNHGGAKIVLLRQMQSAKSFSVAFEFLL
jgi:hypothetical protein